MDIVRSDGTSALLVSFFLGVLAIAVPRRVLLPLANQNTRQAIATGGRNLGPWSGLFILAFFTALAASGAPAYAQPSLTADTAATTAARAA